MTHPIEAANYIQQIFQKDNFKPQVSVILGSGLSEFADKAFQEGTRKEINYNDVPGFPHVGVSGHRGILYYGQIGDKQVIAFAGRFHSYEGYSCEETTFLPQLSYLLGVKIYILTNAAGCTDIHQSASTLMTIEQNGQSVRRNVLNGLQNIELGEKQTDIQKIIQSNNYPLQIDTTKVYSKYLKDLADQIVEQQSFKQYGIKLYHGDYVFNIGPIYESKTDIQEEIKLAPGSVGMSSVPEADMASMLGLECYGVSLLTNMGAGLTDEVLSHDDVKETANKVGGAVVELVSQIVKQSDISKCTAKPLIQFKEEFNFGDVNIKNTQFQLQKNVILVPYYRFEVLQQQNKSIILIPNNLSVNSCILLISKLIGCENICYIENNLEKGELIQNNEVLNLTEQIDSIDLQQLLSLPQTLHEIDNYKILATSFIESYEQNNFLQNLKKELKIKYISNKLSGCLLHMTSQLNIKITICSYESINLVQNQNAQIFTQKQLQTLQNQQVESFKNQIQQPTYEAAVSYYHQKIYQERKRNTKFVLLIENSQTHQEQIKQLKEKFQSQILIISLPQNSYDKKVVLRSLKFSDLPIILFILQNTSENSLINDVLNFSQQNQLLGENNEKFGPRFTDLSHLYIDKIIDSIDLPKVVGVFESNVQINKIQKQPGREIIYQGAGTCILTLKQMQMQFQGFILKNLDNSENLLQKLVEIL